MKRLAVLLALAMPSLAPAIARAETPSVVPLTIDMPKGKRYNIKTACADCIHTASAQRR